MVPWSACLWFLLNFGSVPLRDGYLWVFGFLILLIVPLAGVHSRHIVFGVIVIAQGGVWA